MKKILHSVELVKESCIGCTDCIKRCPTEAIRVRNGKAKINEEVCIDCGMCIRVCRNRAKKAVTDSLDRLNFFEYTIAIPAPSLYAQFKKIRDVNIILSAIKKLGFDEVFEVSKAAEAVTAETKKFLNQNILKKPIITSACPAIIRLITMRFPSLIENILPMISPMEIAAISAKNYVSKKTGIDKSKIGVFFISPCAAKRTNTLNPLGVEKSQVDGVIGISDIYMKILDKVAKLKPEEIEDLAHSTYRGVEWALIGGESKGIQIDNAIAVDGMENVIDILENLENGQIKDVDFIEALACIGGCVGGPLTIENSFIARNTLKKTQQYMAMYGSDKLRNIDFDYSEIDFIFDKEIEQINSLELDENLSVAISKLQKVHEIHDKLPLIDCGSCGAPTCQALAEDIVRGYANIEDCVFMLREEVRSLAQSMMELTSKLPQTIKNNLDE